MPMCGTGLVFNGTLSTCNILAHSLTVGHYNILCVNNTQTIYTIVTKNNSVLLNLRQEPCRFTCHSHARIRIFIQQCMLPGIYYSILITPVRAMDHKNIQIFIGFEKLRAKITEWQKVQCIQLLDTY